MKGIFRATCLAILIAPAIAAAQDYGCDTVNWGEEVLKAFPNASKGCHSVMMKNNQPYAKYVAEVQSVDKKTKQVTLHMLDTKDKGIAKVVIAPKEGAHVKIDGKDTPVSKLKKGDRVSFYIPHDRWGLYADPESTPINIISREDL